MISRKRVRRVGILCCHCVRNIAYYRGGWINGAFVSNEDFWKNTNSNFIDIAVLEWCKLFADRNGKHHWKKVVLYSDEFRSDLFQEVGVTEDEFLEQLRKTKKYRDKFVAHLDDDLRMNIPELDLLLSSTKFLFRKIREIYPDFLIGVPDDMGSFYEDRLAYGKTLYPVATT